MDATEMPDGSMTSDGSMMPETGMTPDGSSPPDASTTAEASVTPDASMATISGVVTDATGAVLSGVTVASASATTATKPNGTFTLAVPASSSVVVAFSKTGYLPSSKAVAASTGTSAELLTALVAVAPAQPLDADTGGTVSGPRGSSLTVGAGTLVDQNGHTVTGTVQVSLTPLDPSMPGEFAAYPGSLVGSTGTGTPSLLQTFGVLDVTVTQNGAPVQIATGQTANVTIPVALGGTLPSTEQLWSFDLATAIWDHEGTATLQGSAYVAQLAHFSYHNIDGAVPNGNATCITGLVVDTSGNPIAGAIVAPAEGADADGRVTLTGSDGSYCTWAVANQTETITADATYAPYGQGSVDVTAGASIPFPGTYSCSSSCTKAPNIVIQQTPCSASVSCESGDTCCPLGGQLVCQSTFACVADLSGIISNLAPGDAGPSECQTSSDCPSGDVCCAIPASQLTVCTTQAQCNAADVDAGASDSGACGASGSVTGTVEGQVFASIGGAAESAQQLGEYLLAVQLSAPALTMAQECEYISPFFGSHPGPVLYANSEFLLLQVEETSPIVVDTPYPVTLFPTDAGTGIPAGAFAFYQSSGAQPGCDGVVSTQAQSGTIEFCSITSTTVSGTVTLSMYGGGALSGSFTVPVCATSGYDAGSGYCVTP
jgi:hypothetical protein